MMNQVIDPGFQVALSVGVPTLAVLISMLINNSRLNDLRAQIDSRLSDLRAHMDARFDDSRETWRAELRRVEGVLDARLKHLEER
jgi:hypothetical protein